MELSRRSLNRRDLKSLSGEFTPMTRPVYRIAVAVALILGLSSMAGAFPKPSPYPITWELQFEHSAPKRIVVTPAGSRDPKAYWYITYTVTNPGPQEQQFLPYLEMLTDDGRVIRSDISIPTSVLETIRLREKNTHLMSTLDIGGTLRVGEDQAKDGVAIWAEPTAEMGNFSIFVSGLSGEAVVLKDDKGQPLNRTLPGGKKQPIVLHKALQMEYLIPGDEQFPGHDEIELVQERWVMR